MLFWREGTYEKSKFWLKKNTWWNTVGCQNQICTFFCSTLVFIKSTAHLKMSVLQVGTFLLICHQVFDWLVESGQQKNVRLHGKKIWRNFFDIRHLGSIWLTFTSLFLCWSSRGGHFFWPPAIVYISAIITHITNYNLSRTCSLAAYTHI